MPQWMILFQGEKYREIGGRPLIFKGIGQPFQGESITYWI